MSKDINTIEEAESRLEELVNEQTHTVFCPLINGNCRIDCVAFDKGSVEEVDGHFFFNRPQCNNTIFERI